MALEAIEILSVEDLYMRIYREEAFQKVDDGNYPRAPMLQSGGSPGQGCDKRSIYFFYCKENGHKIDYRVKHKKCGDSKEATTSEPARHGT